MSGVLVHSLTHHPPDPFLMMHGSLTFWRHKCHFQLNVKRRNHLILRFSKSSEATSIHTHTLRRPTCAVSQRTPVTGGGERGERTSCECEQGRREARRAGKRAGGGRGSSDNVNREDAIESLSLLTPLPTRTHGRSYRSPQHSRPALTLELTLVEQVESNFYTT